MARLEDVLLVDTRGAQPVATAVPAGTLYAVSDENFLIEQSDGATWSQYGPTPGGGANAVTAAGTLTASRLVLGAGAKTVAEMGSLGTTTTVLHGNAAGAPTFGAVTLTTDVTGVLPVANGGTGISSGFSPMRVVNVSVVNADVKKLPSVPFTIVPAPGAGFRIKAHSVTYSTNFDGGAYTGVNATFASLVLQDATGDWVSGLMLNDSSGTLTDVTTLFGATNRTYDVSSMPLFANSAGWVSYVASTDTPNVDNSALSLFLDNNGSPTDLGGGDASNLMVVRVYYSIESTAT